MHSHEEQQLLNAFQLMTAPERAYLLEFVAGCVEGRGARAPHLTLVMGGLSVVSDGASAPLSGTG